MKLYLRLAWRNIWRHRSRTLIVVLAIGLTMMLMMAYDGMLAGFERSLASNAVRVMGGNIQVHGEGYRATADSMPLLALADDGRVVAAAEAHPQVVTASRRINTNGLASNREGAFPVNIIGIEPDKEILVNLAAQNVVSGRYLTAEDQDMIFIPLVSLRHAVAKRPRATSNPQKRPAPAPPMSFRRPLPLCQ